MQAKAWPHLFCLLALLSLCLTNLSGAVLAVETFGDQLFRAWGLCSDLVVSGTITDFEYVKIPGNSYLGSIDCDGMSTVIKVTLGVSKVLAGDYSEQPLSFIVREGILGPRIDGKDTALEKLRVGDPLVAVLDYNIYDNGLYVIVPGPSLLRIEGDKLVPYVEDYSIESEDPLRVLQEAAAKRAFNVIAAGAEIVCVATLLHNDTRGCVLTLETNGVLKGRIPSKQITLDYLHDFADWTRLGPKFLLFLKPHNGTYVLSAGMNSVYTLSGDRLLRNRLPLKTTFSKVKEIVEMSKEKDQ